MKLNLQKLVFSLLAVVLLPAILLAEPNGYLTYKSGTPEFMSATGFKLKLSSQSTDGVQIQVAGTPVVLYGVNGPAYQAGKGEIQSVNQVVFAATAVAGTNQLVQGYNIPGATATANHLVLVGSATAIPGAVYDFYNQSTATLKLKMPPGITMNGATAGGTLLVATLISARCIVTSATNIDCRLNVNPTPAAA